MMFSSFGQSVEKKQNTFIKPSDYIFKSLLFIPDFNIDKQQNTSQSLMLNAVYSTPKVEYNTTIFCKFEHRLMMSSRLPLKLRLGDVQYVDRLEGKK